MKSLPYIALILLFISTYLSAQESAVNTIDRPSPVRQADKISKEVFNKEQFPGMAVVVAKNGEIIFSETYGYADIAESISIDPEKSLFRIGSISKPYTAAALGVLYEQGVIDLDLAIQKYVPEFPKKKFAVSLRQLAGHLGGIRHYRGGEFMSNKHYPNVRAGLQIFREDPLLHEPGTKYSYSSYGWNLISAAIETAAEQEFLSFITEVVFQKVGMLDTYPDDVKRDIPGRVKFYSKNGQDNVDAPEVDNSYKWAGGGFVSSPYDVIKFAQAHLDHTLLSEETMILWTKSQTTKAGKQVNYGIGWRSGEDQKGRYWYGHSGGSVGGTSMMLIYPESDLIVVTLVNLGSARTGNLAFRIANQFLAME